MTEELEEVFSKAPQSLSQYIANSTVLKAYQKLEGKDIEGELAKQRDLKDEPCPICFEDFKDVKDVSFCKQCGHNIHKGCWSVWVKSKKNEIPTCVYCRSPNMGDQKVQVKLGKEGYVNLAKVQGISDKRPEYEPSEWDYRYRGRNYDYYDHSEEEDRVSSQDESEEEEDEEETITLDISPTPKKTVNPKKRVKKEPKKTSTKKEPKVEENSVKEEIKTDTPVNEEENSSRMKTRSQRSVRKPDKLNL